VKARHVIHTVAPVFALHAAGDVWRLLGDCYRNSLALAAEHGVASIAYPSLGTGAYGIPIEQACEAAVRTTSAVLRGGMRTLAVVFCCFSASDAEHYREAMMRLKG